MPLLKVVARHLVAVVLHVGLAGQTLCCLVLDIIQAIAASVRSRSRRCGISLAARNYFDGKTVWITGASSGIGRSVATELANLNATSTTRGSMRLVLMGRSPERLAPVQKTVEDRVSEVVCATVDMADAESVKTFVDRHGSTHCPDVVILCAGISQRSSCADLTMETLDTPRWSWRRSHTQTRNTRNTSASLFFISRARSATASVGQAKKADALCVPPCQQWFGTHWEDECTLYVVCHVCMT